MNFGQMTPAHTSVARKPAPVATQTAVPTAKPTATSVPTRVPTAKPTSKPPTHPAPPSASFPGVAGNYSGSIYNTPAAVNSTMILSQMQQQQGNVSGHLTLGQGLQGDGDFTGTVTKDNRIQFLVPGYLGHLPLFFEGQFQNNGSITGTYCSYQNNQCNNAAGGYGTWNVAPNGSPSASISPSNSIKGPFSAPQILFEDTFFVDQIKNYVVILKLSV
ncbi:hypothetical protein [Dictyobacter vulcani]|nr:hypothetical protein [Dictyobacter vulcani]